MKPNPKAQSILNRIYYATLSTVSEEGQPWNSPVYCAYDENYNVYWGSHIDSQHSKNIRANGKVFIVVYDSTVAPGGGEGVYIKASVTEILDTAEIAAAHKLLQDRRPSWYWKLEQLQPDRPVHLFKATPEAIWMNGEGEKDGQYIDTRVSAETQKAKRHHPPIIHEVGFDFSWDERKVWQLDAPVEEIPIEELTWHFDIPFWSKPGGFYDLKAQDVIDHPDTYAEEYERTMQADTSHPIDIMQHKGRWVILDGLHRLVKQALEGKNTVRVRKIPRSAVPLIRK